MRTFGVASLLWLLRHHDSRANHDQAAAGGSAAIRVDRVHQLPQQGRKGGLRSTARIRDGVPDLEGQRYRGRRDTFGFDGRRAHAGRIQTVMAECSSYEIQLEVRENLRLNW